jgi:two-component system response regulator FixJ
MKRRGIGVPVIIMTGNADVPKAVRAMKDGAVDFIEKPLVLGTLLAAIETAQARQASASAPDDPQLASFRARLPDLTGREREILEAVVGGQPTKTIAQRLGISPRTVDAHRARISDKLGVVGLSTLVRLALSAGIAGGPAQHHEPVR